MDGSIPPLSLEGEKMSKAGAVRVGLAIALIGLIALVAITHPSNLNGAGDPYGPPKSNTAGH